MMLMLVFVFVALCWMLVGAVQFLICVAVPGLRKYALSAALWWAMWGPCSIALILLAGLAVLGEEMGREHWDFATLRTTHFPAGLGWGYLVLGVVATVAVATLTAWLHQAVVRRFTFALFRLYAMAVAAGIGSVFGWLLGWWMIGMGGPLWIVLAILWMAVLVVGFGTAAYQGARALRGDAPTAWAVVSREEFEGVEVGSR